MKTIKFIILYVLVDIICALLIFLFFLQGMNNNITVRTIQPILLLIGVIYITYKNLLEKGVLLCVTEAVMACFMFVLYKKYVPDESDILQTNFAFIQVLRGLIALSLALVLINFTKKYVTGFLKSALLFYHAHYESDLSVGSCMFGAIKQFKSTASIPIFTSIVHKAVTALVTLCKNSLKDGTPLDSFLEQLGQSKIIQCGKKLSNIYINYADECVLTYCYKYPKQSLLKSSVEAISIFLKDAVDIFAKIGAIVAIQYILNAFIYVGGFLYFFKTYEFTLYSVIIAFVVMKSIVFIFNDAIMSPILMNSIVREFSEKEAETIQIDTSFVKQIPFIDKLGKLGKVLPEENMFNTEVNSKEVEESIVN